MRSGEEAGAVATNSTAAHFPKCSHIAKILSGQHGQRR